MGEWFNWYTYHIYRYITEDTQRYQDWQQTARDTRSRYGNEAVPKLADLIRDSMDAGNKKEWGVYHWLLEYTLECVAYEEIAEAILNELEEI